ncbi:MAG: class I SAM-dependent methyltransferase [bacterium]|nr:class I SAM-dependent methyltransferase [bacterium]
MRRVIEELIEKRKKQQDKLKESLNDLGLLIEDTGPFFNKKKKGKIAGKLLEFNEDLNQLMTIQDKEWDAYSNNHSTSVFKSLQWKIEKLEAEYSNVKTLLMNFVNLETSLDRLIKSIDNASEGATDTAATSAKLKEIKGQLSTYQYSDFEQRFRGDEGKVKEKLKKYLPVFSASDHVLDIGCGRGEFIELLQLEGKKADGIDISQSMLRVAEEKGLNCKEYDALQYLEQSGDESIGGIFSAQVIEHLQPEYLRELVQESFRSLKKGAHILLETVNPLSVFALSNIYFLDVTHQKPLHPEYMRYLLESSGFSEVDIIYSDELVEERLAEISPENQIAKEFNSNMDKLNKLLYSSPVYAVRGKKP